MTAEGDGGGGGSGGGGGGGDGGEYVCVGAGRIEVIRENRNIIRRSL